ncbi:MAG TPA: hypothetical protein VMR34_00005 [Candidatus Saccharimonadales bacterium]|nr:hypothetical protein [Candidatus Saccharimonadales bacterium]
MAFDSAREVLDRAWLAGFDGFGSAEFSLLRSLSQTLAIPYIPSEGRDANFLGNLKPFEKARFIQTALGSESIEDAQATANGVVRTLSMVCALGSGAVSFDDFLKAKEVVDKIWLASRPLDT